MPAERFFLDLDFSDKKVSFEGDEFHHLTRVMRVRQGDAIECVNGRGMLAQVKIEEIGKRKASGLVESTSKESPPDDRLILIQAIPRLNRLDTIIEKVTELGVTDFWLFPGNLSEKKELSKQQMIRVRNLSIAAMKQCGRLYLPNIEVKPPLQQWEGLPSPCYFGDLAPNAPHILEVASAGDSGIVIGPESGLTEAELDKLAEMGAKGVQLHQHILRTDTAAILSVGFLSQLCAGRGG